MEFYTTFPPKFLKITQLNQNHYWYGWSCWVCGTGKGSHSVNYGYIATPNQDGSIFPVCDRCAAAFIRRTNNP